MKVKYETWTNRGVSHEDIGSWISQRLIVLYNGMIWTTKSPSKWPQEARDRYYETAGKVAKANGERQKAWNAQRKAEWAKVVEQYGEGVREVAHRCNAEQYASAYVTAQVRAFNYDGTPHFCDRYVAPVEQSPANVEPKTDEYTYCPKCQAECGWTSDTQYSDIGYCPKCEIDCILPENHPVRVAHRAWVAENNRLIAEKGLEVKEDQKSSHPTGKTPCPKPKHNADCTQAIKKFFGQGSSINELLDRTCPDCHSKIQAPSMKAYPAWLASRVQGTQGPKRLTSYFRLGR